MRTVPGLLLVALALLSGDSLANPSAGPMFGAIFLVLPNIPLNGLILLAMYLAFARSVKAPSPQGVGRHIVYVLSVVVLLTFVGAIVDSIAFYTESYAAFAIALVIIALSFAFVAHRYMGMDHRWSLATGLLAVAVNSFAWTAIIRGEMDLVYGPFILLSWLAFLGLLVFEARAYHDPDQKGLRRSWNYEGRAVDDGRTSPASDLNLGELLLYVASLGVFVVLISFF